MSVVKISVTSARQFVKMAGVGYVTVSQETIIEIVARLFRDQEREETQETYNHVVDELIQEVTDTIMRETIEDTKITTCLEEGLPPEISQLIQDYDDSPH